MTDRVSPATVQDPPLSPPPMRQEVEEEDRYPGSETASLRSLIVGDMSKTKVFSVSFLYDWNFLPLSPRNLCYT